MRNMTGTGAVEVALACTAGGAMRVVVLGFSLAGLASSTLVATAADHTVTVNPDGTFNPRVLRIDEGDKVEWVAARGTFTHTDAIVPIGLPSLQHTQDQICGAVAGGPRATVGPKLDVYGGPRRKGLSGIHALGPQGYGFIEASTSDLAGDCNSELDPNNIRDVRYYTNKSETVGLTKHLLCTKLVSDGTGGWIQAADARQGGIGQVLQSTWDNPDIDGVVMRVLWKDFQYDNGVSIVTDWTAIDREFREAIKRGKMISINIHAGEDTPPFIFTDYDRDPLADGLQQPVESDVEPVWLKDFASGSTIPNSCGRDFKLGSPADPNYVAKIKGLYEALAAHFRADARFFQVLGYVKVSGLNLETGEARLPKRCLEPDAVPDPGVCVCNTERWAHAVHAYTPEALYTFYNEIENTILREFMGDKSLHYMLIQDGFPRVLDADNYFRDYGFEGDADSSREISGSVGFGFPGPFEQTVQVLEFARLGRFALPGNPATLGDDTATGKLFVAQHSGLLTHPLDAGGSDCPQTLSHGPALTDSSDKNYYPLYLGAGLPQLGEVGSGCPNHWAAEQGYRGQLIGYQTSNEIVEPAQVDSSLWNMTSASNAMYYEIYEDAAWTIAKRLGTGPGAAALDMNGAFPLQGAAWQKNLGQWGQQLHARRESIAATNAKVYPHLADPFPASHSFTFAYPMAPGIVTNLWYVNPARCATSTSATPYGLIQVVGR